MSEIIMANGQRAVQYIRVSTDHQHYSAAYQKKAIAEYGLQNGYEIIETYADEGRSGLSIEGRKQLIRLLHDVTNPARQFSTILVFDVSRWGRFQDADQHGAYEFLCRQMGVNIEYVGELFSNDGSSTSAIMKGLKRIMAAEYSRELSGRMARTARVLAERGHKGGSISLYGFRRMVVDKAGHQVRTLEAGERTRQIRTCFPYHFAAGNKRSVHKLVLQTLWDRNERLQRGGN